jgi:iojap-like ribosome-associated protein
MNKLELIIKNLNDKQAKDIIALNMEEVSPLFDVFVICSASNVRLMQAMKDHVEDQLEENGFFVKKVEGKKESTWTLMDYGDIIVHIFDEEERGKYLIEKLWGDVPRIDISNLLD